MDNKPDNTPVLVVEYTDQLEGFKGWLAIDRLVHSICAGGMRVQPDLSRDHLVEMARNMSRKMRMADLRVDGAKCGIDYDPASPGKAAAVRRFLKAISPYIESFYSMGPDLNIDMAELEAAASQTGLPSVKMAIARAQGWDLDYFMARSEILSSRVDGFTLGQLRAGYGVAAAVLGTLETLQIHPEKSRIAVQGFGALAKATLYGLRKAGCRIVAISDEEKSIIAEHEDGLDLGLLLSSATTLLPDTENNIDVIMGPREAIFACKCDILVPAAKENTISTEIAEKIQVRAVVPGANLAVPEKSDKILFRRGIPVIPDFLAGCGGSLSMEGLYGPDDHPDTRQVLDHVMNKMLHLVKQVMEKSRQDKCRPTEAALSICNERQERPGTRPYGKPD